MKVQQKNLQLGTATRNRDRFRTSKNDLAYRKVDTFFIVMIGDTGSTVDGLEVHMAVNHLGHFLLTRILEDDLVRGAEDQVQAKIYLMCFWNTYLSLNYE